MSYCIFCRKRPATMHFGDMLSFTHGGHLNCCAVCCVEKQLAHARKRAAAIPELERKLADALTTEAALKPPNQVPDVGLAVLPEETRP